MFLARLWENIAKPPKLTIKVAAEDVKRSVNRLLANCTKELHKNAQDSGMMLRRIRRERQGKLLLGVFVEEQELIICIR